MYWQTKFAQTNGFVKLKLEPGLKMSLVAKHNITGSSSTLKLNLYIVDAPNKHVFLHGSTENSKLKLPLPLYNLSATFTVKTIMHVFSISGKLLLPPSAEFPYLRLGNIALKRFSNVLLNTRAILSNVS